MNYLSSDALSEFFTPLRQGETSTQVIDAVIPSSDESPPSSSDSKELSREKRLRQRKESKVGINKGFEAINSRIPFLKDKKISKIKSLRLSTLYILHLQRVLADEMITDKDGVQRPLTVEDFEDVVLHEMKRTEEHATRARQEITRRREWDALFRPAPVMSPNIPNYANMMVPSANTFPPPYWYQFYAPQWANSSYSSNSSSSTSPPLTPQQPPVFANNYFSIVPSTPHSQ